MPTLQEINEKLPPIVELLTVEQLDDVRLQLEELDPAATYTAQAQAAVEAEIAARLFAGGQ